jgi:acyl-CoA synthetase (AMP-forming)/AMP-acid ligase II
LRTGSAALSAELQRDFERKYGLSILVTYGATEFCGVIVMWTLEDHRLYGETKRGSAGRPRPGVSLRIRDAQDDRELPAGQVGQLEILVSRVDSDWIQTTDLASIDEDGFLFLHGRADDAINRGGFKVMPEPVAEALRRHPAVADAAVVGVEDRRLGEVPVAAIELREGRTLDADELKLFLRDTLLAYQIPARFLCVDALPRTPSLKVDRQALRALFAADASSPSG